MPPETEPTAPKGERSRGRVSARALLLLGAVALLLYAADQLAKHLIVTGLHEGAAELAAEVAEVDRVDGGHEGLLD